MAVDLKALIAAKKAAALAKLAASHEQEQAEGRSSEVQEPVAEPKTEQEPINGQAKAEDLGEAQAIELPTAQAIELDPKTVAADLLAASSGDFDKAFAAIKEHKLELDRGTAPYEHWTAVEDYIFDAMKASRQQRLNEATAKALTELATTQKEQVKQQQQELDARRELKAELAAIAKQSTKPMSLADKLKAKKEAAAQAALRAEPSAILSSDYQAPAEQAAVPAVEIKTGTASPAPGYAATAAQELKDEPKLKTFDLNIQLNAKQLQAKDMAMGGQCFCLIGPAGSGKTTTQREVAETLLEQGKLHTTSFKLQGGEGARASGPSIAFVAYTRRAAANLQRAVHKKPELEAMLRYNIMTIHALLEYQPYFFWDEEKQKESMRFEPQRHAANPLDITHLVIEEASMVGLDLWAKLFDALRPGVQIIFIGDINQLPPVFGPSILNYALVQLPVVELDRVYRQADDSHILENAHKILAGETELTEAEDFQIMEGKNPIQVGQSKMAITLARIFEQWYKDGTYDPEQDMILSPFNKQDLGTTNMNKFIAQFLGMERGAVVYEIIAGFTKHYLAVGDRVMVNKQDGVIEEIVHNGNYMGQAPQPASAALSRFGVLIAGHPDHGGIDLSQEDEVATLSYENFSLASLEEQDIERKQQASHICKVRILDSGELVELTGAGDYSEQVFSLGHVLTVHKAQGCEWRKVFFIMHKDHATMHYRELVYTACTRAREQFIWIAKRMYIAKAIKNPRIKGDCLADKIEYFNANLDMAMNVRCVPAQ